jgi:hypothetical protein
VHTLIKNDPALAEKLGSGPPPLQVEMDSKLKQAGLQRILQLLQALPRTNPDCNESCFSHTRAALSSGVNSMLFAELPAPQFGKGVARSAAHGARSVGAADGSGSCSQPTGPHHPRDPFVGPSRPHPYGLPCSSGQPRGAGCGQDQVPGAAGGGARRPGPRERRRPDSCSSTGAAPI